MEVLLEAVKTLLVEGLRPRRSGPNLKSSRACC